MKTLRTIALQVILSGLWLSGPVFAQVASNPDEAFVTILHDILSGANPDFEAEVRNTSTYREADEFSRADVLKAETARLREKYTEVARYKGITIPVSTSLGEWDSERSGFPIALFKAGAFIKVGQGFSPGVAFSNPIEARYWNLSIDVALF